MSIILNKEQNSKGISDARTFLNAMYAPDDLLVVRFMETWTEPSGRRSETKATKYIGAGNLASPEAFELFDGNAAAGNANFFFGVCPRSSERKVIKDDGGTRSYTYDHACQIRLVRCLWADHDHWQP